MRGIRQWLESTDGRKTVDRTARSLLKDPFLRGLFDRATGRNAVFERTQGHDDLFEEVCSELVCFLLEAGPRLHDVVARRGRQCSRFIRAAFINHLKDRLRRADKDPQAYLYRRIVAVLKESDWFYTVSKGNLGTAFSIKPESAPIPSLVQEDLYEISFPIGLTDRLILQQIGKTSTLVALAEAFWRGVSTLWDGTAIWVDVRDMVAWIGMHVQMGAVRVCGAQDGSQERLDPLDQVPDERQRPDRAYFDAERVKQWAGHFARQLDKKQAIALVLVRAKGLSLKAAAEKLDLAGPSGAKYHLGLAEDNLRAFLRDLPWLSPPDLNKKAFALFWDTLVSILKQAVAVP